MSAYVQVLLEDQRWIDGLKPIVEVSGLSSPKVCHLLNRLVATLDPEQCYLEVGTWQGLTLLSAAHNNPDKHCIACDKFRLWGRWTGWGYKAHKRLRQNMERYKTQSAHIDFYAMDSRRFLSSGLINKPVGIYFYDGDHSFEGTYHGILDVVPLLADEATILVDDWNDPIIRGATLAALKDAKLEVLWEHDLDGDHSTKGWWNGLGAFYVKRGARQHS